MFVLYLAIKIGFLNNIPEFKVIVLIITIVRVTTICFTDFNPKECYNFQVKLYEVATTAVNLWYFKSVVSQLELLITFLVFKR